MLRIKKYNNYKNKGFNLFFKNKDEKNIKLAHYQNIYIKKTPNWCIIKENILGTYLLCLHHIHSIHLTEKEYNDFQYLYKDNHEYVFKVYSNLNSKDRTIYHLFCINLNSKLLTQEWLDNNDCEYNHKLLTQIYGSFIIMNKRYNQLNETDLEPAKYKYKQILGNTTIIDKKKRNIIKLVNLIHK